MPLDPGNDTRRSIWSTPGSGRHSWNSLALVVEPCISKIPSYGRTQSTCVSLDSVQPPRRQTGHRQFTRYPQNVELQIVVCTGEHRQVLQRPSVSSLDPDQVGEPKDNKFVIASNVDDDGRCKKGTSRKEEVPWASFWIPLTSRRNLTVEGTICTATRSCELAISRDIGG